MEHKDSSQVDPILYHETNTQQSKVNDYTINPENTDTSSHFNFPLKVKKIIGKVQYHNTNVTGVLN